ncbi:hypothetical protein CAG99_02245 [Streptomyces marincola]|uniref:Uncharacterized protein n=1 Tax=Streptomyces marincola TaxID=2878388 RepID=A0A1W7CSP2_9ACTN|nr:hypothetical protein CAG99_02245 [Streptomyces marincola]
MLCARLGEGRGPLVDDVELSRLATGIAAGVREQRPREEIEERLDALEDLLLRAGHTAGLGSYRSSPVPPHGYGALPGLGEGRPLLEVVVCPRGRCTRVEVPPPRGDGPGGEAGPRCALFDDALKHLDVSP